jgi:hypothetical protein
LDYLCRLLQLLTHESNDTVYRGIILQEMSNVCHLEYGRVQKLFGRHVQTDSGSKYFKRVSGVYDNGIARIAMKNNPEIITRENPQVHYMVRLCQARTNASKAVTWIKKLDDLRRSHPTEREEMEERELDSFSDLAVIAGFVQSLSASTFRIPFQGQFCFGVPSNYQSGDSTLLSLICVSTSFEF